jgi:hypothetical protein
MFARKSHNIQTYSNLYRNAIYSTNPFIAVCTMKLLTKQLTDAIVVEKYNF